MVTVPRGVNPFIAGNLLAQAPQVGQALMSPVPLAMQGAPVRRQPPAAPMQAAPQAAPIAQANPLTALAGGMTDLGGDPGLAFAAGVLGGGSTGEALGRGFGNVLATRNAARGSTDDLKEYAAAKSQGYTGTFIDFMKDVKATSARAYGLNPIYARDPATGKTIALQPSNNGGAPRQMDAPDGYQILSPGELAAERQTGTVDAKTAGAARAALPAAEQALTIAHRAIDSLRNDAAGQRDQFGRFLGVIPQQWTLAMPGTDKADFRVKLEQATGQAFMQARNMLKGGGQITDYEGRRGESAYARMTAAAENGSRDEFLRALDDFEQAVDAGYQKLQQAAQGGYTQDAVRGRGGSAPADVGGDIDSLIQKYAP